MQKKYLFLLMVCFYHSTNAQQKNIIVLDSLTSKDYSYFESNITHNKNDSLRDKLYAKYWLTKAKSENNFTQMALAYKSLVHLSDKKFRINYADSAIIVAKKTKNHELIGASYMTKGVIHYDNKEQIKALDNYLIANQYISKTNNEYLTHKVKYGIAQTKYYLGFYHEAIVLFKECINYFKDENDHAYLNSLHSLGLSYNRIGEYELCKQTNQTGLSKAIEFDLQKMIPYFLHSDGVNDYFMHKYPDAVKKLTLSLSEDSINKDFANQTVAYFYIGKSYWAQNKKEKALLYFKKVDDVYKNQRYIRPDLREAYELLIIYFKQQKDVKNQLYYINKLLEVDQFLNQDFKYLSGRIHKEYDTAKLLQAKQNIENSMKLRTIIAFSIIMAMTVVILFLIHKHYKNKRLFMELMNRKPDVKNRNKLITNNNKEIELDINPELVSTILKNLEMFEKNKKYLEKEMTLTKLASILNTNTKYASKIISKYRNKGTIEYINDLKIDYIVELLKNEKKYRNYTNKALGEEAGFGSTQNFTRAFNNHTGISPTYFIHKLNKANNINANS